MIKYYIKKSIVFGLIILGITVGIITQPITENKLGVLRIMFMILCIGFALIYNEVIEGRMDKHGRC